MTRDEVIRLAHEAGFPVMGPARTDAERIIASLQKKVNHLISVLDMFDPVERSSSPYLWYGPDPEVVDEATRGLRNGI